MSSFVLPCDVANLINNAIFQRSVFDDLTRVACVPIHFASDVHHDG